MPTRTFTIYEVPNDYVATGNSPTISATFTMTVTDDDGSLEATEADDGGTSQVITVDGGGIDDYEFFYDDDITVGGGTETIKTFQLTIGGVTRSFVMNDDGDTIPGAGVGVSFTLNTYATYTPVDYTSLPCFVRGTLIGTADGDRPVEDLKVGDLIETMDQGLQPIRWIGNSPLSLRDLITRPNMRPVIIPASSFGKGYPQRDLHVSPQHRCLLGGWSVELNFGMEQALAPAKSMVGSKGIHVDTACTEVDYFHFMFDRHEVVFSEGLATESFLIGDTIREGMDQMQLQEILELFPELADMKHKKPIPPARPILRQFEVAVLEDLVA